MAGIRGLWYTLAKLMEDYNAVKKRKVGNELAAGWQERPPARRCGSCSSRWLPWQDRCLKFAHLIATLMKLRRQQHNQVAFSV